LSDGPENILLVYLRRLDAKLDQVVEAQRDHGRRLTSIDLAITQLHGDYAGQSIRIDRLEARLDRIERRLEISDA
jgi:hypothetical protein